MESPVVPELRAYLANAGTDRFFGPGPAELLQKLDRLGSLRAAAHDMNMAYSKAQKVLRKAEESLGLTLTVTAVGGQKGGGSRLTPEARELLVRYRNFELACEQDMQTNFAAAFAGFGTVPKIGCVVLAAGASSRFDTDKPSKLLECLEGVSILERTLSSLPHDLLDIVVVACHPEVKELASSLGYATVCPEGLKQSDSVKKGLSYFASRPACLFVPGDQALLNLASVKKLIHHSLAHPHHIVRLSYDGVGKSPILWPAEYFDALFALAHDAGGSELLRTHASLHQKCLLVEAEAEVELIDIDTRTTFEELTRTLQRKETA